MLLVMALPILLLSSCGSKESKMLKACRQDLIEGRKAIRGFKVRELKATTNVERIFNRDFLGLTAVLDMPPFGTQQRRVTCFRKKGVTIALID